MRISLRQLARLNYTVTPIYSKKSNLVAVKVVRKSGKPVWNNLPDGIVNLDIMEPDAREYMVRQYGAQKILQDSFKGLGD
jgi:hypothetical protein